jgi:hypothetical protein
MRYSRGADRIRRIASFCVPLGLAFVLIVPIDATLADVTRVVVKSSGPMGEFEGREYLWVAAMMEGTVDRGDGKKGHYRVPVVLMYPDRNANAFGFTDIVNSAEFAVYNEGEAPARKRTNLYLGDVVFSDYLRREGFTYMAVQWSRMATYVLGADYGVIEDGRDGYEIIKDATRFLRHPNSLEGDVPFRPQAVAYTIGFGFSQTGALLLQLVHSGQNRATGGSLIFDGILAGTPGGLCLSLTNDASPRSGPGPTNPTFAEEIPCREPLPEDGKLIAIQTESDIAAFKGYLTRRQTPSYRQYELAGISHIPSDLIDLGLLGATRQNPMSLRPVFKAMLRNLVEWLVAGKAPPDSMYIEGNVDGTGGFTLAADADGNVKGGLRLPHMPTVLRSGERVGAPLGVYRGLDPDYKDVHEIPWIGGTFEPFSAQELGARYPSRDAYVELVSKAAAALLADRFLLQEDHDAYIQAAKRWR